MLDTTLFTSTSSIGDNDADTISKVLDFMNIRYPWAIYMRSISAYSTLRLDFKISEPDFGKDPIFKEIANKLTIVLNVPTCSATRSGGIVTFRIPRTEKKELHLREGIENYLKLDPYPLKAYAGERDDECPAIVNFGITPHVLIGGQTQMGKTSCLHNILISLMYKYDPSILKIYIFDIKSDLSIYKNCPHVAGYAFKSKDFESVLKELNQELEKRNDLCAGMDIDIYNESTSDKLPRIIAIFDEAETITNKANKNATADMARSTFSNLVRMGASRGMHVIISTQKPVLANIDSSIKSQMAGRIAFRLESVHDSKAVLENSKDAAKIPAGARGTAIAQLGGSPCYIQTAKTDYYERIKAIEEICKNKKNK